jgi:hypothetical protein
MLNFMHPRLLPVLQLGITTKVLVCIVVALYEPASTIKLDYCVITTQLRKLYLVFVSASPLSNPHLNQYLILNKLLWI